MTANQVTDQLICEAHRLKQALDEHVDALAAMVLELRRVAQLPPVEQPADPDASKEQR